MSQSRFITGYTILISAALIALLLAAPRALQGQQTPAPNPAQASAQTAHGTETVRLKVTVMDKRGSHVYGLKPNAFTILDNKVPQDIASFIHQDSPASIGILFDASGSMDITGREKAMPELLRYVRDVLEKFMQQSNPANEYFLIGFNQRPQLLADWTNDGAAMLKKLDEVNVKGQTALYDSCYVALEKLARAKHQKRILLLVSDGQDNKSVYNFKDVRQVLGESGVVLYALGISMDIDPGSALGRQGQISLAELASASGGKAFFPEDNKKKIRAAFAFIADDLRYQYLISFTPKNRVNDGKWHPVKVKVTIPPDAPPGLKEVKVYSSEGYYAPKAQL